MTSRKGPVTLIVVGALLGLSPLWGLVGTAIGMIRAFGTLAASTPGTPEKLAKDITMVAWSTMAGIIVAPIGVAMLVSGIVWLVTIDKRKAASPTSGPT